MVDTIYLLMASIVGITRFAKVGYEVEDGLGDAHVLPRVILPEIRVSHHQRQPKDVRNVFATYAAQPLQLK